MHLSQCLTPKRIFSKPEGRFVYVPCGKCSACRNARASYWTQRLQCECKCWKYVLFVTLTYSPDKRPMFIPSANGRVFVGSSQRFDPAEQVPVYDIDSLYLADNSSDEFKARNDSWLSSVCAVGYKIPHLSRYDLKLFIKRLRKNLYNHQKKIYGKQTLCSDYFIRYFAVGEYGETSFLPHYHCLFFFNSAREATAIKEVIYKSWQFGIVNASFVANDASQYVASYVNSFAHLPLLLQQRQVRPFSVCSKSPTIGSLFFDDKQIREIFDACSPTFLLRKANANVLVSVPLWRSLKDRIFPKLAFFDKIPACDRMFLYGAVSKIEGCLKHSVTCCDFVRLILTNVRFDVHSPLMPQYFWRYIELWRDNGGDDSKFTDFLIRWYYVSNRVYYQSVLCGVSISEYVSKIETFYENFDKENFMNYLDWQNEYSCEYGSQSLCGCDLEFLVTTMALDDDEVDSVARNYLLSYGVDLDKFFSSDEVVRLQYRESLIPENQKDYINWFCHNQSIARRRVKNKKKNDYLASKNDPVLNLVSAY